MKISFGIDSQLITTHKNDMLLIEIKHKNSFEESNHMFRLGQTEIKRLLDDFKTFLEQNNSRAHARIDRA